MHAKAIKAEKNGNHREALRLFQSSLSSKDTSSSITQLKNNDIQRVINTLYGVKGSDQTMSMWKDAPLMSKTKPPLIQFYACTQMGRCIYRHGGIDFGSPNSLPDNNDVWEFDIDKRTWRVVEVKTGIGSNVPEHRSAHTMFSWKGDLYIWGGMQEFGGQRHVAKPDLYRLKMKGQKTPQWELVKTKHRPPGRSEHAGVVYRGKYYITCGNFGAVGPGNDTWCLNLSNFKWASLRNGNGPVKRHCHNMWAANNKLYVLGGRIAVRGSSGELSNCSSPSIEEFVSYDLETKTWSTVDIIGDDRPHDLSEYTVLPLYKEELDDDPSTIIVFGGYREVELARLNEGDVEGRLKAQYGEEWRAYTIPYISRLLRFDVKTNVWKRLQPIKDVLPKAQSIACVDKVENGVIHLLIGEGYGIDPEFDKTSEENKEEIKRIIAADACAPDIPEVKAENYHSPKASNKMYEIMITEAFGDADLKNCWSWDIYRLADNKLPRLRIAIAPYSPTLHNMIDLTYEDFLHSGADAVLPNDEQNLLGVRVQLHGLVGRKELNGMVARCGYWMAATERYQVFLPLYESDSSISVKPSNLNLAGPVTPEELARVSITPSAYPRRFPKVGMAVQILNDSTSLRIVRPLMEEILDAPVWDEDTKLNQLFDSYLGPVSGKAQIILRTIGKIEPKTRSGFACVITAAKFTRPKNSKQAKHAKNMEIYVNFLRDLKERDTVRVQGFEAKVAKVDDSMVLKECGEWLKLTVKLDGVLPPVTRELIISPHVTVRCLHDQVLTAVMGWASNFHAYAFRKIPFIVDELNHDISLSSTMKICDSLEVMKESCWMGPKVECGMLLQIAIDQETHLVILNTLLGIYST